MSRPDEEPETVTLSTPSATITNLSIKSFNRRFATFLCELHISNPYVVDLPISDISYTLKSAGRVVATGLIPDPGWIKAGKETKVEVTVEVPYDFLVSVMKDVGRDWDIDYELDVGLIIDLPIVGNVTIPLSRSGEMKLPTLPSLVRMALSSPAVWFVAVVPVAGFLVFLLASRRKLIRIGQRQKWLQGTSRRATHRGYKRGKKT